MSQQILFFSTMQALKRGSRIDSKCKIRSLNPMLDNNGIFWSCGRLHFAQDNLEVEKFPIIVHAKDKIARLYIEHAHNICVHQGTEPVKIFVQQRYHIIGLCKNTFEYKLQMFSLQTICRSKHSTPHGSPSCLPFPNRLYPATFCEQRSRLFWSLLYRRCQRTD